MEVLEKTTFIDFMQTLPDRFSVDEVMERVMLLAKVQKAQEQLRNGESFSNDEMKVLVKSWAK
ncbi:MAG: hypothetical protein U5N85_05340 [Arcicella sp.]|nr:hypothetical protein [Arcicella sp.]